MQSVTVSASSLITLYRPVQLDDINSTIKLNKNQTKTYTKQNDTRWCQRCNKPGAIEEKKAWLAQIYKLRTNHVKNATSVSSS